MSGRYYTPGRYVGKLTKQQLGVTKNNNPQIVLSFTIIGQVDLSDPDGDLITCQGYERSVFRVVTPKTIDWILDDLDALGFEGSSFAELEPGTPGFQDLTGKEVELSCDHETYEGTVREKWSIFSGEGSLNIKPLEARDVRKLDAMFGKALKARRAGKPVGAAKGSEQPAVAGSVGSSDERDLPF